MFAIMTTTAMSLTPVARMTISDENNTDNDGYDDNHNENSGNNNNNNNEQ